MSDQLVALLGGRQVGRVHRNKRGKLTFTYDLAWLAAADKYPLSLSMPLSATEHGPEAVEAFLWGLLPDSENVLDRWARKYQVSARNVFALLAHVGEDCAGAVQFIPPERLEAVLSGAEDDIESLDESAVAGRLRTLREDPTAWRLPRDMGQFSLAGAQPKTALVFQKGKWGIPSGRIPTTHIFKPPTGQFEGHAENEHICLTLAHAFGMPTAKSRVMRFGNEIAIVVERYDRLVRGNEILRVHQEDMCQALGIMPTRKYQNEGGPDVAGIAELLRAYSGESEQDVHSFIAALGFNWLIAGTDAHGKNYSVLHAGGSRLRLAPLYDIASVLPYDEFDIRKVKLSMKIGGEYLLLNVGIRQWRKLARDVGIDADELLATLRAMAERMPDEVSAARKAARKEGLKSATVDRLTAALIARAEACRKALTVGQ
jgi:serine/threonine-protein kinase HipA